MSHQTILNKAYDPESFQSYGVETIAILYEHLKQTLSKENDQVIQTLPPEEEYQFWKDMSYNGISDFHKTLIQRSIHLHHPRYIGHQVVPTLPLTAVESMVGAMLNNGMAVYEMGQAATALERLVIDTFKPYFGYDSTADGIMTSGGTIANLTALLCARGNLEDINVWHNASSKKFAFMVSEEAHYCIDRAVRIMGWGDDGIIIIPSNEEHVMKTELLESYLEKAKSDGIVVIGVVGSAPSTSTGKYDDLTTIGKFCKKHDLWFHIDAAHGGPAAFSEKYKHLMHGSSMADSITIDGHKMMMMPGLTTILLFKNRKSSYLTFSQQAQYLFGQSEEEWFNYGKRTMECTKVMMSIRFYIALKEYGIELFQAYVTQCYDLGAQFAALIKQNHQFELAVQPHSNIVCFRYQDQSEDNNPINKFIREQLLLQGRYYIVQTMLRSQVYLRTAIMNPFTAVSDLNELLAAISAIAKQFK